MATIDFGQRDNDTGDGKVGSFSTTNPQYADLMKMWSDRLRRGNTKRERWLDEARVSMDMITGSQWEPYEVESFGAPVTQADILSSTLEIMSATIVTMDPRPIVSPQNGDYEGAETVQAVLGYWYRELGLKSTIKDWVQSTLALSHGIIKLGVTDDRPWITIVDPRNFIIDPVSYDPMMRDARWVAERQIIDYETIRDDDETYPPARKTGLLENCRFDSDVSEPRTVICWECYDRHSQQMVLLAEGHDQPLRDEEYDFAIWEQFPYERLVFRRRPFVLYPQSDIYALITLQRSLNKLLSTIVDHAGRHKTVWLAHESLSDQVLNRLSDASHGDVIVVPDLQGVKSETMATLSGELLSALSQCLAMIREQTGISDYMRGASVRGVSSATESAIISHGDQLRLGERREFLEIGLRDIGRYLYKILRHSVRKSHLVEIDPRVSRWQRVSPEDLAGEYDVQIETGFISPLDRSIEIGRQTQVMQALTPYLEAGLIKLRPMLGDLIRAMGHDPDTYMITDQEADQLAQAQQQAQAMAEELEQLRAQLAQVEELIQSGALQLTQGPEATAVPISELQAEADEAVAGSAEAVAAEAPEAPAEAETIPELEV